MPIQLVIFNPWKFSWNWIIFCQNSLVMPPGLLYHLIRRDIEGLAKETLTSNSIVYSKQWLSGLKIKNWICKSTEFFHGRRLVLSTHISPMQLFCTLWKIVNNSKICAYSPNDCILQCKFFFVCLIDCGEEILKWIWA